MTDIVEHAGRRALSRPRWATGVLHVRAAETTSASPLELRDDGIFSTVRDFAAQFRNASSCGWNTENKGVKTKPDSDGKRASQRNLTPITASPAVTACCVAAQFFCARCHHAGRHGVGQPAFFESTPGTL
jgi:hypothetical protein